jgi:hypothetical protein
MVDVQLASASLPIDTPAFDELALVNQGTRAARSLPLRSNT